MPVDASARRRHTAVVLGDRAAPEPTPAPEPDPVVRGVVTEITPRLVAVATAQGEERFLFEAATTFWCGRETGLSALRVGDDVVVRCRAGRAVAERIWVRLARVTGVIAERSGETLVVDTGHTGGRRSVVVPYRYSGRIGVRHPVLEPGYLLDVIGVFEDGAVQAVVPATTQPPFPVWDAAPAKAPEAVGDRIRGSVSWYDPAVGDPDRAGLLGAAYPAVDRDSDCGPGCDRVRGCLPLPLLSLGTTLSLRNECTGDSAVLPVVDCASVTAHFCDRCTDCGPGEEGRIAQLTLGAFLALGGRPESGCFNATLTLG
ncbi:hypothetical protein FZ103_09185 [Streptomonospora sp. PA3]|uniref:hypothetical protein n=1 Tax=Streptomonospora sp. PA3 TaxID=2607326 RepID=UPI0012DF008E|nr:hypothetical protein [Streptomonospora sp. PA3]MUL41349.1 hypothetical protein [Streptomonospora sp. PA3]